MTPGVPELEEAVRGAIRPSWAEIVRAKKAIRELLADGEPYGIRKIQGCLLEADGVPLEPVRGDRLQLTSPKDIPAVVRAFHPLIARPRLALAATEALLDLLSLGIIVEVAKSPQPEGRNPIVGSDVIHVSYEMRGYGSSVRSPTWLPDLAPAYRLAPRLRQEATQWFFDADLFTADLEHLDLDSVAGDASWRL